MGRGRCIVAALWLLAGGCARLSEQVSMRVAILEEPRQSLAQLGERRTIAGERQGAVVRATAHVVQRCADVLEQRAAGFRVVERHSDGPSLTLEWLFGGLFVGAGSGLFAWTALSPVDLQFRNDNAGGNYAIATAISALGVGLLAGAIWDTAQTGRHEFPLGERTLRKQGPERVCGEATAPAGQVRLTLPDGTQLEAALDATGHAEVALPADVEQRLQREDNRRATLEVLGDATAQVRVPL